MVVVTAFGNVDTAVRTVHEMGAYWFLEKPVQPNVMQTLLRRAATHHGIGKEVRVLERQPAIQRIAGGNGGHFAPDAGDLLRICSKRGLVKRVS